MNGVIIFVIGVVAGCIISLILKPKRKTKVAGDLLLYKGENDEFMSLYLELEEPPEKLHSCKQVIFNVKPTRI